MIHHHHSFEETSVNVLIPSCIESPSYTQRFIFIYLLKKYYILFTYIYLKKVAEMIYERKPVYIVKVFQPNYDYDVFTYIV